jgi:predicted metalloendopeptidase
MEILNKNWKNDEWKAWYVYMVIRSQIHYSKKLFPIYFDFYKKYVKKIYSRLPIYIMPMFIAFFAFNKKISEIYEKSIYNQKYIDYVIDIFIRMKHIFKKMIEECKWLSPKAKKNSLLKIEYLKLSIGSSKNLLDDPNIEYRENDIWYNITKIFEYRKNVFISIDGISFNKIIPYFDWVNHRILGKQLYLVNAFYTPTSNDIFIPLAIIQYPFINIERPIEFNLARIGYAISHEIAHCLDNTGRLFDYTGKLNNIWNSNDVKIFNQKKMDIIKQYEYFSKKDGIIYNASPGVGEDIADIIGLKILVVLLRNEYFIRLNYSIQQKKLTYTSFFINYVLCLQQKINKGSETSSKIIDIHPLAKYRVNVPLSRIQIFRFLYDVEKGDGMYWHNMDTIY